MKHELYGWISAGLLSGAMLVGTAYAEEHQKQLLDDDRDGVQSPIGINEAEPATGPGQEEARRNRNRDFAQDQPYGYGHGLDGMFRGRVGGAGTMKDGAGQGGSGAGS